MHVKLCCLAYEKYRIGICLRSNLISPKFQTLSGGPWPQIHLAVASVVMHAL